ncbi:hypothetical protein [Cedecea sp.]|jgi:hypothetical protein|uniref:hypothetical protein n=1 Tax=Cedecea sp. TaxID=1970739 RepID=UPI002F3E3703
MELKNKELKLSEAQVDFMRRVADVKGGYALQSPSCRTGTALVKKGLVMFHWGVNRWALTFEGGQFLKDMKSPGRVNR